MSTQAELDNLIKIYQSAREQLLNTIVNSGGVGTQVYANTVLKQLEAQMERMEKRTGKYIEKVIPVEYEKALQEIYGYFTKNHLMMKPPQAFARLHNDAIYIIAREMQYQIAQGLEQAGRQVLRYVDEARDNALRQAGLAVSGQKAAAGGDITQMRKNLIDRLQSDGFMTVQYGTGKAARQVAVDAYAAMVSRSTTREAGNLARENQLTANGYDLVEMTTHYPTCERCAKYQGRVYSITGNDKRFPALMETAFKSGYHNIHPNCRHSVHPWIEDLQDSEDVKQALEQSKQPFDDGRQEVEVELYNSQQAQNRQMRQDRYQYERYKARLGEDAPKSFHAFRQAKKTGGEKWEKLQYSYNHMRSMA